MNTTTSFTLLVVVFIYAKIDFMITKSLFSNSCLRNKWNVKK